MSLRCAGGQLLQTAPSLLLGGASNVSASFWIQVNPGNNVVAANGVEIFGEAGGKFSATLSGTGKLQLLWSSNDGTTNFVSSCTMHLTPGTSYHVAATWQAGSQNYYLDGVPVSSDSQPGKLGVRGDTASYPYRLGSDQAGADVTLDQPTLWVGYSLTAQDVANLRDRKVQPGAVSPASIALQWSLAGTGGAPAKVGDAGLADASPNGLALSKIVGAAPTYVAGDLTYVAPPPVTAAVAPSGRSILLYAKDASGAPAKITSLASSSEVQSIAIPGQPPAGNAFTLKFGNQTTAPIPVNTAQQSVYLLCSVPAVVGHNYALSVTSSGGSAANYLYEIIESGVTVATFLATGKPTSQASGAFQDPGVAAPSGTPVYWQTINPALSASATTVQVRLTAVGGSVVFNGLRVADLTAGTVTYYDCSQSQYITTVGFQSGALATNPNSFHGCDYQTYGGSGLGPIVTVAGGASAVQSALEALTNVGAGNVVVSDQSGGQSGFYRVNFTGSMANAPQPLFTSGDANVSVAEVTKGGVGPGLSVNGAAPVTLTEWLWVTAGDCPVAMAPLPQSAPAVQTFAVQNSPFGQTGPWGNTLSDGSVGGGLLYGASPGATLGFSFPQLPPGTYQLAITYPTAAFSNFGNFIPANAVQFLVGDGSGKTVATLTIDQTQAPADYQSGGHGWKVLGSYTTTPTNNTLSILMTTVGLSNSGNPMPVAILDAVQLVRTSADNSIVIGPGDSATIGLPANWLATSAGPIPAIASLAVSPPSPNAILPPFVAGSKTMKAGYNVQACSYASNFMTHSNLAMMLLTFSDVIGADQNGYPTQMTGTSTSMLLIEPHDSEDAGDPSVGTRVVPPGMYRMTWTGTTTDLSLRPFDGTTITEVSRTTTGNTHQVICNIQYDAHVTAGPYFLLRIGSTVPDVSGNGYDVNVTNLGIYPPDPSDPTGMTAWANPTKFHPTFLSKLQGMACLRFLSMLNVNNNPFRDFAQIMPSTHLGRYVPHTGARLAITKVQQPPGGRHIGAGYHGSVFQVTTATPHGLFDGCVVNISGTGVAQFTDGPQDLSQSGQVLVYVIDPTNLLCVGQGGPTGAMTNVLTTGTLNSSFGTCWPLQDVVDLMVAVGASDLWFNVPLTVDASVGGCADQMAAFLAAKLPPGIKVHVEVGNEQWNFNSPCYGWSALQNSVLTGTFDGTWSTWYTNQCKVVHDRFQAVFAAAGRPNDVIRTIGSQEGYDGITGLIAQQAQKINSAIDEIAIGSYWNNSNLPHGFEPTQQYIYPNLTADQHLDFAELNAVYGRYDIFIGAHKAQLATYGFKNTQIVSYEGSASIMVAGANDPPPGGAPNYYQLQNAVKRHPRMYGIILQVAQLYQDAGMALLCYFNSGGSSSGYAWDAWEYFDQQPGTGSMTLDAVNVANPQAKNAVKSQVGGAWAYWSSLVPATITKSNTTKVMPARNGKVRSLGLPRGMFRMIG